MKSRVQSKVNKTKHFSVLFYNEFSLIFIVIWFVACDLSPCLLPSLTPFASCSHFSIFLNGVIWGQLQYMLVSWPRLHKVKEDAQTVFLPVEFHYWNALKSWVVSVKRKRRRLGGNQLDVCSNQRCSILIILCTIPWKLGLNSAKWPMIQTSLQFDFLPLVNS